MLDRTWRPQQPRYGRAQPSYGGINRRKAVVNLFPSSDYAHCPHCGSTEGMGLCSGPGNVGFVRCLCGAQGPQVSRTDFTDESGSLDLRRFDDAVRHGWNCRAGSNGLAEIQVQLNDAVARMIDFNNPAILPEVKRWAALMAAAHN